MTPIPSPMTEARLAVMQRRAAAQVPLAEGDDQPAVAQSIMARSIQSRGKSSRADGQATMARSVRTGTNDCVSREARFDEEGDVIEEWHEFAAWDRYLAIALRCRGPLSREGRAALDAVLAEWRP